ncbi:MAG: DUF3782 domain-containing protein, partial [Microcystaceae cyanobacterium]
MSTTAADVWEILAEVTRKQAELTASQQETDRQLKETDRQLKEQAQKTDREIRQVNRELGNLGGKWGRFVENMVAPACETLFLKRGIPVHQVSQRVKKRLEGQTLEIDILVTNENHVLVVEVKSSLGVGDVKALSADLSLFRQF